MTNYVNLNSLIDALKLIKKINSYPLSSIIWVDGDLQQHTFDKEQIDEWRFVGLSNVDFAKYKFYLDEDSNI